MRANILLNMVALVVATGDYFINYNEWCYTKVWKMTVELKGCNSRVIPNNYCYGQCNSYYLPSGLQENEFSNGRSTMYCTHCAPSKTEVRKIPLYCPNKNGRGGRFKSRKILIVKKCKCIKSKCNFVYPWQK